MEAPDDLIAECLSWDLCIGVTVDDDVIFFQRPFDEKRYVVTYDRYGKRFKQWLPVASVTCMGSVSSNHLTSNSVPIPNQLTGKSLPIDRFLNMCEGVSTFVFPYVRHYTPSSTNDVRRMIEETLPKIRRDGKVHHIAKPKQTTDEDGFTVV